MSDSALLPAASLPEAADTSPAPFDLDGFSYDPDDQLSTRDLWLSLRNIVLAALRYEQQRRPEAHAQTLVRHLRLQQLDERIVERLRATAPAAYSEYLAADGRAQAALLFSDDLLGSKVDDANRALEQVLADQARAVAGTPAAEWLPEKAALLRELGAIKPIPNHRSHNVRPWVHYYAWRRADYLGQLERHWLLTSFAYNEALLREQLEEHSDLALLDLEQFTNEHSLPPLGDEDLDYSPPTDEPTAQAPAPAAGGSSATADFYSTRKALDQTTQDLKKAAAAVKGTLSEEATLDFEMKYAALSQRQEAYTYLLNQKKSELPLMQRAKAEAQNFVTKNKANTGLLLSTTFQTLFSSVGSTVSQAVAARKRGEPVDGDKLAKDLLTGLGITLLTAGTTYLLGPLGPIVSGMALNQFFPRPDPVMLAFDEIKDTLQKGFAENDRRLRQLSDQVKDGFVQVDQRLAKLSEQGSWVVSGLKLHDELRDFRTQLEAADALLLSIRRSHADLFELKNNVAFEDKILSASKDFGTALDKLVRQLYRRDYNLELAQPDRNPPHNATVPTLAEVIINHYQDPREGYFRPFHVACEEITALCDRVRVLLLDYFDTRRQFQEYLSAVLVFHKTQGQKPAILAALKDLARREETERAAYFAGAGLLDWLVLGARNHALYRTLHPYLRHGGAGPFDMRTGFGLLTPHDDSHHFVPTGPAEAPPTGLRAEARNGTVARYYVAPLRAEQAGPEAQLLSSTPRTYELCSFWPFTGLMARLPLHLALAAGDEVRVYDATFSSPLSARVAPLTDPVFANSLDQFLALGQARPAADLREDRKLTLPKARVSVSTVSQTYEERIDRPRRDSHSFTVRLHFPNGWAILPAAPPAPAEQSVAQVLPAVRPDTVGIDVRWNARRPDGQPWTSHYPLATGPNTAGPLPYGVWTQQQALGTFRPAYPKSAVAHQAFSHQLLPGHNLVSLRSPSGEHYLQFDDEPGYGPVLYYYTNGQRGQCVFSQYHFREEHRNKDGQYDLRTTLQSDGNLVIYDSTNHVVAALHTWASQYKNSTLRLDDDGRLRLLAPDGTVRLTLPRHPLHVRTDNRRSYWQTGERVHQDDQLWSANGRYQVQLHFHRRNDERKWLGKQIHSEIGISDVYDTVWNVGLRFVRRESSANELRELDDYPFTTLLVPPVAHADGAYAAYYWDKCSKDTIDYLNGRAKGNQEMKVFIELRDNGEVTSYIGAHEKGFFSDSFGLKELEMIRGKGAAVLLGLENDGSLRLREVATGEIVKTLLEPRQA